MLGDVARWLRIAGYDTVYHQDMPDEHLIEETRLTGRTLLTRDRVLVRHAAKQGVKALYVEGSDSHEKLAYVASKLGLSMSARLARCPRCNGELEPAAKPSVRGVVPLASYEAFDEFWVCRDCGAVYWKGSHWGKIEATLEEAGSANSECL